jgi:magnesium-dependent phosphatase 1
MIGCIPWAQELATHRDWEGTQVAYVSRTEYPHWAGKCLNLFTVTEGVSMHDVGVQQEIYPGTKTKHFRRIQER